MASIPQLQKDINDLQRQLVESKKREGNNPSGQRVAERVEVPVEKIIYRETGIVKELKATIEVLSEKLRAKPKNIPAKIETVIQHVKCPEQEAIIKVLSEKLRAKPKHLPSKTETVTVIKHVKCPKQEAMIKELRARLT